MHLAGYSSNILHPLLRVLDGSIDELRTDALDTICSLALALGPDFPIFAPTVRKVGAGIQYAVKTVNKSRRCTLEPVFVGCVHAPDLGFSFSSFEQYQHVVFAPVFAGAKPAFDQ